MKTIILIAGTGRSGSSLLEMLILQRINACSVGELKYLWHRGFIRGELCACGRPVTDCAFWRSVGDVLADGLGDNYREVEGLRRRVERHRLHFKHRILGLADASYQADRQAYIGVLRKTVDAIGHVSGLDAIIDGSKDPAHIDLMLEAFPEQCRLVHLVRDSRAVAYSWQTPKQRKEVHWAVEMMGTAGPLRASIDYAYINWAVDRLPLAADRRIRVRYEDLVRCPDEIIASITKRIADGRAPECPSSGGGHSVSGNPMRLDGNPPRIHLDERWKTALGLKSKILVTGMTYPFLRKYSYV